MKQITIRYLVLISLISLAQPTQAKDWFGGNNGWGGFGNGYDCNDWPEWTPMYWMEEMVGDKPKCDEVGYGRYPYQSPVGYGAYPYASPYAGISPYGIPQAPGYPAYGGASPYLPTPYAAVYGGALPARSVYGSRSRSPYSSFSGGRSFPGYPNNAFGSPFSSFSGARSPFNSFSANRSPFSSFGGGSPWSSFGSPMSPMTMGGMGSPMGGFGSPMSPMSMGTMGMPGMSPFGSLGGGYPFGGSGFRPF